MKLNEEKTFSQLVYRMCGLIASGDSTSPELTRPTSFLLPLHLFTRSLCSFSETFLPVTLISARIFKEENLLRNSQVLSDVPSDVRCRGSTPLAGRSCATKLPCFVLKCHNIDLLLT